MKIEPTLFDKLKKTLMDVLESVNAHPLDIRTERDRWDILFLTEMPSLLYKADLNDDHIDTALRKIFA